MSGLLPRGLAGGVGVALLAASASLGVPLAWMAANAGLVLLLTALLAGRWPVAEAFRFGAALLLGCSVWWGWHLNPFALLALPLPVLAPLVLIVVALGVSAWTRGWALPLPRLPATVWLSVAALWLYSSARWFSAAEWAGDPGAVVHGLATLVGYPVGLLAMLAAASAVPGEALEAMAARGRRWLAHESRFVAAVALAHVALAAALCWFAVGPLPHVEDGIAYLYQAKTFLAGGLRQPAPVVPAAFDATFAWVFMDDRGWSYGIFPPGWPLLLAAGVAAGVPWLVNPLLGGLNLVLVWRIVRRAEGPAVAAAALLLLATSPFYALMNASFLSHPATLLWILLAVDGALALLAGTRRPVPAALAVGLGVGMALATRYVEGMLLGLVLLAALGWGTARGRVAWRGWVLGLLGLLPGLGLALADNAVKTGSPLQTPVERWYTVEYGRPLNRPGFGPDRGLEWDHSLGPGHSLVEGLWNTNANLFELNRSGLGWPSGSLLFALLGLAALAGRRTAADRLWLAYGAALVAVYTAYWYHGIAFGPRFLHPLIVPLVLWTAKPLGMGGGRRLAAAYGVGVLVAWLAFVPLELATTYDDLRGRDAGERRIVAAARERAGGAPVVVVQAMETGREDYGVGFSLNPAGFRGDVLVARERTPAGESLLRALHSAFPERMLVMWYKEDGDRLEPVEPGRGRRR